MVPCSPHAAHHARNETQNAKKRRPPWVGPALLCGDVAKKKTAFGERVGRYPAPVGLSAASAVTLS